jgi:hypothetical protein
VIRDTRESGVARRANAIRTRRELGGCKGGTGASTPVPLAPTAQIGKEPWLMLPWFTTLRVPCHAVQFATEQAYA